MAKTPTPQSVEDQGMEILMDSMPHLQDELNGEDPFSDEGDEGEGQQQADQDDPTDQGQGDDDLSDGDEGDLNDLLNQPKPQPQRQERRQQQQPPPKRDNLQRQPMQFNPNARLQRDQKGNILDQNGQVVARAGAEARIYERVHGQAQAAVRNIDRSYRNRMGDVSQKLQRAVDLGLQMDRELERYRARDEQVQRLGVNDAEQMQALQLVALSKTNPLEAVKQVLTQAAARGIDLTQLGLQPGSFDPKSLLSLVEQKISEGIKPVQDHMQTVQQQHQNQQVEQRHIDEAARQANEFFGNNPEAVPFLPIFEKIVAIPRYATMPLDQIWDKIQLNLLRNRQNPARQQRQQGNRRGPGLPNGQRQAPVGGSANSGKFANPDESYESIVRSVVNSIRR